MCLAVTLVLLVTSACRHALDEPAQDPASSVSLDLASLALARHGHRAEVLDGVIYAFGGFSGEPDPEERGMCDVRRLDLASARWEPLAPLAVAQAFAGSAVLDGALYAVGGDVQRYDPVRDAWEVVLAGSGLPDSHFACARVGDRLYVLGGYPAERSGFHVYDAATNAVETLTPPPGFEPTDHFAFLFALDGELHLAGGLDTTDFQPVAQHLVFAAGEWTERPPPPIPIWRKFTASGVVGGAFYVFIEGRGLRYDGDSDAWSEVAPMPAPLVMPAGLEVDGRLLVLGGVPLEGPHSVPRAGEYVPALDSWRVVP